MNYTLKILSLSFVLFMLACTSEDTVDDTSASTDEMTQEETSYEEETKTEEEASSESIAIVEPPRDSEEVKIIDDQAKSSPFFNLGCCETEDQRKRTCCCEKVVEKYKEIRAGNDADLILKIKTEDPIFSGCKRRSKWRKAIEDIENPPASEDDEEDLDF